MAVAFHGASLAVAVMHIVSRRTEEEMIGTNTGAHITAMADKERIRDGAVRESVGEPMRLDSLVVV